MYRLAGVGPRGSSVIAKRGFTANALKERMVYEKLLPRLPLPALRCYGSVTDANANFTWLFLEEAGPGEYTPFSDDHRALAAHWLAALHSVAMQNETAHSLNARGTDHYLWVLRTSQSDVARLRENPFLLADDVLTVESVLSQLDSLASHWSDLEAMCADCPPTLVHGDFAIKNVRVRDHAGKPALFVFDWELAGWGVPATDLAQFTGRTVSPNLEAYCRATARFGPPVDLRTAQGVADCGKFFRLLDDVSWTCEWLNHDGYEHLQKPISCLRSYEARLADALAAVRWTNRAGKNSRV